MLARVLINNAAARIWNRYAARTLSEGHRLILRPLPRAEQS